MSEDDPRRVRTRRGSWVAGGLLLAAGSLIGLTIATDRGRLSVGQAVSGPPTVAVPLSPPISAPVAPSAGRPDFVQVARLVTPAVVNIATTARSAHAEAPHPLPFDDPFFRRFFGDQPFRRFDAPRDRKDRNLGSGVIVGPSGLIVTNNHVVGQADVITVLLADKRQFKATVIGSDAKTDIAVIKIATEGLPAIPWGDSDQLQVGEYVLAVGNPFGLNQTVTMGIVSAVGRASMGIAEYEDFIQTDAAINPGNSGGALVNARGELVGINTAIFSQSGGSMGIGFAVPSSMARMILDQLTGTGRVVRGWLGVSIQELTPDLAEQFGVGEASGVLVSEVLQDSPAQRAGVERGDVIVGYDGMAVDTPTHLRNVVAKTRVGRTATLQLVRQRRMRHVDILIVEQPKAVAQVGAAPDSGPVEPAGAQADLDVREMTPDLAGRFGLDGAERGVIVMGVRPGSPAEEAGLKDGDVIVEVNRRRVNDLRAYRQALETAGETRPVLFLIKRHGFTSFVTMKRS